MSQKTHLVLKGNTDRDSFAPALMGWQQVNFSDEVSFLISLPSSKDQMYNCSLFPLKDSARGLGSVHPTRLLPRCLRCRQVCQQGFPPHPIHILISKVNPNFEAKVPKTFPKII